MAEDLFQSLAEHRLIEALSQLPENYLLKSPVKSIFLNSKN